MSDTRPVLRTRHLCRQYVDGDKTIDVLNGVDLSLAAGDMVAIVGQSGCGKSTLLQLLGGLDRPTSGEIWWDDTPIQNMSEKALARYRNRHLGFVYQFHHLLPEFDAVENVAMPLLLGGASPKEAERQAKTLLESVGLAERYRHRPGELSGGERQRVAFARALACSPKVVLADEPTGNLDEHTAEEVFALMVSLNKAMGTAFLVVTHSSQIASQMDKIWTLKDGQLTDY
ncbi:MAG: ABC transporter ATP-binding protein [Gammaproteobacteria bacterium]|nr:MAG: ABC transporter ATP-binding protein [Gammaproteobacteria bacterium]